MACILSFDIVSNRAPVDTGSQPAMAADDGKIV